MYVYIKTTIITKETSNMALLWPLLAGFHDTLYYKGHAHKLYDLKTAIEMA